MLTRFKRAIKTLLPKVRSYRKNGPEDDNYANFHNIFLWRADGWQCTFDAAGDQKSISWTPIYKSPVASEDSSSFEDDRPGPSGLNMHMTRPKSSKGRSRARLTLGLEDGVHQGHVFLPHPPLPHPPPLSSSTEVSPRTVLRQAGRSSAEVLTEVFPEEETLPVLNFNKYKVLPSIEKRPEAEKSIRGAEEKTSSLSLTSRGHSESETGAGDAHLLLAIRTPRGQRFKCHFQPTDTLQTVVAAAQLQSGEQYQHAVIETMEVPRQTFTNLTRSLSQCGICNKSLLIISLEDSTGDAA
uniref:UBX domain protein 10 n=1 Tax=Astyanax mexicanus TaxID=7994 RepID=A0A3B1JRR7_ASTMX